MAYDFASHYQWILGEIRERIQALPADDSATVVLFGDSLSEANPARELGGLPVLNMGVSGDEIYHPDGGLMRRYELLAEARPRHVVILIGVNDLNNSGKSAETIAPHYDDLLEALKKTVPGATLHLLSLLPTRGEVARLLPSITWLNGLLAETARRHGAVFVDTFPILADESGALRAEFTYDGLHLTEAGYIALNGALDRHLTEKAKV